MYENDRKSSGGVVVSEDVIVKIAEVAAKDVPGVKGLASRTTDLRSIVKDRSVKPVQIEMLSGAMEITMYITVCDGVRIPDVCEAVQKGVKNSIQSMTGHPVTKVNIIVDDLEPDDKNSK